ncbi:MAG: ArsR/SmtB family transcription factor [Acidimicrobiales bacterium]
MDSFAVLADPIRRRLLDELRDGERPVGALVDSLRLSQPTVSKHLRVLREAGMVAVRANAQQRCYRVVPEPLEDIHAWLSGYRKLWSDRDPGLVRRPG